MQVEAKPERTINRESDPEINLTALIWKGYDTIY
jgi:hypothetical protein